MSDEPNNGSAQERALAALRADLDAARSQNETFQRDLQAMRRERDEVIKSRDGLNGQLEKQRKDLEARIGELTEQATKAKADGETALAAYKASADQGLVRAEFKAAAIKAGAVNADDLAALTDLSSITRDEKGALVGLDEAVTAARENRAYLFGEPPKTGAQQGTTQSPSAPIPGQGEPMNARTMDPKDYAAQKQQFLASK